MIVGHLSGGAMPLAVHAAGGVGLLLSAVDTGIRRERGLYFPLARGMRTTP